MTGHVPTEPAATEVGGFEVVSYNADIELALIGAVLLHGPAALEHLAAIDPNDFSPVHAPLWIAAAGVAAQGLMPDPALITDRLGPADLEVLGGPVRFRAIYVDAMALAPVLSTAIRHAEILQQTARARRLQATALELASNPTNGHVNDLVDQLDLLRKDSRSERITLTPATEIAVDRPNWIWDQRIPVGGVTLMAGREGDGKTFLVCWLAARLSQGQLPGHRRSRPADVVYIGLEDDPSTVLKPRLMAAGADLARFHFVDLSGYEPFTLDAHLEDLASAIEQSPTLDVGLIVFDPLDAHLGGTVDSNKKAEVQAAIARLAILTQDLRCGALGLAHFNKGGINDILTRINGSRAFTTAVRSVLAIGAHPNDDNDRLCMLVKANMTSKTDVAAIRFRIEGATIDDPAGGEPIPTGTLAMLGEETGHHAENLLSVSTNEERSLTDDAIEWLEAILADGPVAKAEITKLARLEGISERPLRTAQQRLAVIAERDPTIQGRPSTWRLPNTGDN